jgi:hypothetical protein
VWACKGKDECRARKLVAVESVEQVGVFQAWHIAKVRHSRSTRQGEPSLRGAQHADDCGALPAVAAELLDGAEAEAFVS